MRQDPTVMMKLHNRADDGCRLRWWCGIHICNTWILAHRIVLYWVMFVGCYRFNKKDERIGEARRAAMAMETLQRMQGNEESLSRRTIQKQISYLRIKDRFSP